MPAIKVNDQHFSLRPGTNRLGAGDGVDVAVADNAGIGVQAIVEVGGDSTAVIRRAGTGSAVFVNGIPLVDPTPLMHGDRLEIGGREAFYTDDTKAGSTQFVAASDLAGLIAKRSGPARATAATGGRLVSLVDGKEYTIPAGGITIGRDATSGVVVAQNEVSRKHAEVKPIDAGYELRDFSANGVFVNGTRLETAVVLSRADVIRVGTEEFRFYADLAPARAASAPTPPLSAPGVAHAPSPTPAFAASLAPVAQSVTDRPILGTLEIVNEGSSKGTQFDVRVPLVHIGRGAHNDVVVKDESVSETHAKLQRRDDGWYVCDVGSTNGTYVAGQRVASERRLDGMYDLRFGGVKMLFHPRDAAVDLPKDTRAIATYERPHPPGHASPAPAHGPASAAAPALSQAPSQAPSRAATPIASAPQVSSAQPPTKSGGVPVWVFAVVVVALVAVIAFFLLNR